MQLITELAISLGIGFTVVALMVGFFMLIDYLAAHIDQSQGS